MKLGIAITVLCCLASLGVFAAEGTPPDLRGTWAGMTNSAVYGTGQHHPGGKEAEFRFRHIEVTFTFNKQEGRTFAGQLVSPAHTEPLVGAFASDLKSGVMVDADGSYTFKVTGKDRIEVCYMGNGGERNTAKVAACYEITRKAEKR